MLVQYTEALTGAWTMVRLQLNRTDITVQFLGNRLLEGPHFNSVTFGIEPHPAISQILNRATDLKSLCHMHGLITKSNTLNVAFKPTIHTKNILGHD